MPTRREFIAGAAVAVPLALGPAVTVRADEKTAPKHVFVVNTQDASVSLVDLAAMKELKRYEVGKRPYGIAVAQDGKLVAVGVEDEECVKFADVSKPCCVEKIPGQASAGVKFLVSNIGDGTLQLAELTADGKLKSLGKAAVGKAPKRVAFLP